MIKISFHILPMMILIMSTPALAQQRPASMVNAPEGSYTTYFKYFDPGATDMPKNAAKSTLGVTGMETARYLATNTITSGSGFLIRTSRTDKKVCLLTAGHMIVGLKDNPQANDKIPADLYFNYLGKNNNGRSETISGINTGIPAASLAAYNNSLINIEGILYTLDYAILLLDKKLLPTKTIKTLGSDLSTAPASNQRVYALGHPNRMPMCIADNLTLKAANSLVCQYEHSGNNNIGHGFSGGPLFLERAIQSSDPVIGLLTNAIGPNHDRRIPRSELIGNDNDIHAANESSFIRLSYIADQIRTHCRQTAVSQRSLTGDPYLEPEDVDNTANWNAFQVNVSASSLSGLNTASSTEYTIENPGSKLVRAKTLTMNFDYQASVAAQNLVTYTLAAETNLENGFSVTAAGNTEFSVFTVVSEPATAGSRIGRTERSEAPAAAGTIYPNPSSNGVFTLDVEALNAGRDYTVQVLSLDGRLVYQSSPAPTFPHIVDIHDQQRGKYIVTIKDGNGNVLLTKSIVY